MFPRWMLSSEESGFRADGKSHVRTMAVRWLSRGRFLCNSHLLQSIRQVGVHSLVQLRCCMDIDKFIRGLSGGEKFPRATRG